MGKGRKRTPAEITEAKGNPGRRRVVKAPALPSSPDALAPPIRLTAAQRRWWDVIVPGLTRLNLLRDTDRAALTRYVTQLANWERASIELSKSDLVYVSKSAHNPDGMLRMNPWALAMERAERQLISLEDRFGLSPRARQELIQRQANLQPGDLFGGASALPTQHLDDEDQVIGALLN